MDLYFQGQAWLNMGTPESTARARSFFERALAADPNNIEALVGSARADAIAGANLFATDPTSDFAAAEAKLIKALSSVRDHPHAHVLLGFVEICTIVVEGIAECEHALTLDPNLAHAHAAIGFGKILIGRAVETAARIGEALRLSPRNTMAYAWMNLAGLANLHLGSYEQAVVWRRRAVEANRNNPIAYFHLAAALAQLDRLDDAHSAVKAGLALDPTFSVSRAHANWAAMSDNPTFLAQAEGILEAMRKAGVPEG
jgi:tetratricopeptide (TPR) repeat protein